MAADINFSADDLRLARALVHDANMILTGSTSADLAHDRDLEHAQRSVALADTILAGKATDEQKASIPELVHPQVRSMYLDEM